MASDIYCNRSVPEPVSTVNIYTTEINVGDASGLMRQGVVVPVGDDFTLPSYPIDNQALLLMRINGTSSVPLIQGTDYDLTGLNGTLDTSPVEGDVFVYYYLSADSVSLATMAVGSSVIWYGSEANIPSNWMIEDGTALSRTEYAALFAIIGTDYGEGDGTTTFNLPNRSVVTKNSETGEFYEVPQIMKVL